MPRPEARSFRFLDLPKELRLMVYENCEPRLGYVHIKASGNRIKLCSQMLPVGILATNRLVHDEAKAIFRSRMNDIVSRSTAPRIGISSSRASVSLDVSFSRIRALPVANLIFELLHNIWAILRSKYESEIPDVPDLALHQGVADLTEPNKRMLSRFLEQSARILERIAEEQISPRLPCWPSMALGNHIAIGCTLDRLRGPVAYDFPIRSLILAFRDRYGRRFITQDVEATQLDILFRVPPECDPEKGAAGVRILQVVAEKNERASDEAEWDEQRLFGQGGGRLFMVKQPSC